MQAAIDIGTNTVLLLIAEYEGGKMQVFREEQRIPRLGRGVDASGNLSEDAMARVIAALKAYGEILRTEYPAVMQTTVTATSAVRDAQNRELFAGRVQRETGFTLRVLSGDEEAEWTFQGALSMLDREFPGRAVTLDIGGGSTEISVGEGSRILDFHSYDIGSVRFSERFMHTDPPKQKQVDRCRKAVREAFETYPIDPGSPADAIGIAGTVTSLAYMEAGLEAYDPTRLAGMRLSRHQVERWIATVAATSAETLRDRYPVVMEGRADIFLPGLLILSEFMERFGFEELTVSTGGVRHGAIVMNG